MARIICVANQKGGVGKTTTSVNVAASLASLDQRVLLVDMDPQANASSGVGVRTGNQSSNVYKVLMNLVEPKLAVVETEFFGLNIIPSGRDLVGAEVELVEAEKREFRLREALKTIESDYDYIIIDCPPSLGLLTLNALVSGESVLIPLQCEFYALEGLGQLLNTITRVKRGLNPALDVFGILLTMFDGRNNLSRQVAEEVRQHFAGKVLNTVVSRNVRLSEAPSHGKPAIVYDSRSAGAQCYLKVAEEILG